MRHHDEPDLSNLHEKSLGRSPMVVTVSARYARVGSFYRYAATHWGRFTATRPLTWGILPLLEVMGGPRIPCEPKLP